MLYLKKKLKNFLSTHTTLRKYGKEIYGRLLVFPWVQFQQHQIHKKLSRIFQQHTRKIRIGFLVTENEKWCCQSLFDKLRQHPHFEPVLLLSSLSIDNLPLKREKFYKNREFFQKACKEIVEVYNPQQDDFYSLQPYNLDIIFYQQPWAITAKHNLCTVSSFALTYYVPYSFEEGVNMIQQNHTYFHRLLFREYISHPTIEQIYQRKGYSFGQLRTVGYPKLEAYLSADTFEKKYVIYAPHHSFLPTSIRLGTFAWNGHFMLEYAKKHPEFNWVFKPHPRLKLGLLEAGLFKTETEVNSYYEQWSKISQVYDTGNYMDLFKQTKCLITDCCSFLVEFFPTKHPVIHLTRADSNALVEVARQITPTYYQVFDKDQLANALHTVLETQQDPLYAARLEKLTDLDLVQPTSDLIIRDLENTFTHS